MFKHLSPVTPAASVSAEATFFRYLMWSKQWIALSALLALLFLGSTTLSSAQVKPSLGNWTQQAPATSPSARLGFSLAYDDTTQTVVLFGGSVGSMFLNDTWTWNGTTWTQQHPASSPPARSYYTMSYDGATGNLVLFGGTGTNGLLGDTWTWNGTTWTQQFPASSPAPRMAPMSAYDAATGVVVLYGGLYNTGHTTDETDTWTWNGTTWTLLNIGSGVNEIPPPVQYSAFAYDAAVQTIVMYGGYGRNVDGSGAPIHTVQYNGTKWSETLPNPSPSLRDAPAGAYDPATGSVLIFGGENLGGIDVNDTWAFDGYRWTQQTPATSPPARSLAQMAYDKATRSMVLFGGTSGSAFSLYSTANLLNDTWTYSLASPGGISVSADVLTQVAGAPVHVTATVLPSSGTAIPTGTLTFLVDGQPQPAIPLDETGSAVFTITTLSPGEHSTGPLYSGDQNYPASSSLYSIEVDVLPGNLTLTIISGAGQTTNVGTPFGNPIVVQLLNQFGNPAPGVSIDLIGPGISAVVQTDSSGQAVFSSVTPKLAGTLPLIASVGTGKPFVQFSESALALLTSRPVNFAPILNLRTGSSTSGGISPTAAVADFNGDGYPDIATVDLTNSSFSVLFGNGNGTFQAPVVYATGPYPYGIVATDLNGDGKPDIAITTGGATYSLDFVQVFLNDGTGHFPASPSSTTFPGFLPYGLITADVNRDGIPDLLASVTGYDEVRILYGNGDGTFASQANQGAAGAGNTSIYAAVGDLNGDGYPDIVSANSGDNTISVSLNDGAGNFTYPVQYTYATPPRPFNLSIGDFNGDGHQDVAVAATNANVVAVFMGNGDGTFQPYKTYPVGGSPYDVLAVDLNGDGFLDLISANLADGTISVLLGRGDGTFQSQSVFAAGAQPYYLLAVDFNNDGILDLSVSPYEYTTGVLLQKNP